MYTRKRWASVLAALIVASGAFVGVGVGSPAGAVGVVTVTPSTELVDGQSVTVEWSGLPEFPYAVAICDGPVFDLRCDLLANPPAGGAGSVVVTVHPTFVSVVGGGDFVDCRRADSDCNMLVIYVDPSTGIQGGSAPISFAGGVKPTVAVAPNTFLTDGQAVQVTLDDWDGVHVELDQCTFDSRCVLLTALDGVVDGTTTTVTVARAPEVSGERPDCVFQRQCFVRARGIVGSTSIVTKAPLWFQRAEDLQMVVTPEGGPSPRPADVAIRGLARGFTYRLSNCSVGIGPTFEPTAASRCSPSVPVTGDEQGVATATLNVSEAAGGLSCQFADRACQVVLEGSDGQVTDRRISSIRFDLGPLVLSQSTGLGAGQPVQVRGIVDPGAGSVKVRQCVSGRAPAWSRCGPALVVPTDGGGGYDAEFRVAQFVGGGHAADCLRRSCRFEVLVHDRVAGAVPIELADPQVQIRYPILRIVGEGSSARIVVRLSQPTNAEVRVWVTTRGWSAEEYVDFERVDQLVAIAPGRTRASVEIPIYADDVVEGWEAFVVDLHDQAGAMLADGGVFIPVIVGDATPA